MRPELLPNHSKPAPEIQQPKITVSAGRSPAQQRPGRYLSIVKGNRKTHGIWAFTQELLITNPPGQGRRSLPHSADKHSATVTSHTRDPWDHYTGQDSWRRKNCHHAGRAPPTEGAPRVEGMKLHDAIATMHLSASHFFLLQMYSTVKHK